MKNLGKLDLVGVLSLGVVAAGLLAGWISNSAQLADRHERQLAREAVTVTADGRMKVTVTAKSSATAPLRQVSVVASGTASPASAISTRAPLLFGP
jgi:hypothetical protein